MVDGDDRRATRARLGELLAAVGNHEAKAVMFLALEDGVRYGITDLHRRFLKVQGPTPGFSGGVTLQQKYVIHSFEPVGLVRRETSEKGFIRHVKNGPNEMASALVGHVLSASEQLPTSLQKVFGKTSAHDDAEERPPVRRLDVLRAVARPEVPTKAQLGLETGIAEMTLAGALVAFDQAGLLSYQTQPTYQMASVHRVTTSVRPSTSRRPATFYNAVVHYLNERLAQAGSASVDVARHEIETELLLDPRLQGMYIRDRLTATLRTLTDRRQVEAVSAYAGNQHTRLSVAPDQQRTIRQLVDGIDAIAAGDPAATAAGLTQAAEIINDTERVQALLQKCYGGLKQVTNPLSQAAKEERLLAALRRCDGRTTAELTAELLPDLNKPLVMYTLGRMATAGLVRRERQTDGPYNRWFVDEPTAGPRST